MAPLRVPRCAEVRIQYNVNGQDCNNILHFTKVSGAPYNLAALSGLAGAVADAWHTDILGLLSNQVAMGAVTATDISVDGGLQAVDTSHAGDNGGITSPALPGSVAFVVKFLTGRTGRSFRGRNFVSGWGEEAVTGNLISVTRANQAVDGYVSIRNAATADLWDWVIVSRVLNGVTLVPPATIAVTDITYTDLTVDTMRSRLH